MKSDCCQGAAVTRLTTSGCHLDSPHPAQLTQPHAHINEPALLKLLPSFVSEITNHVFLFLLKLQRQRQSVIAILLLENFSKGFLWTER